MVQQKCYFKVYYIDPTDTETKKQAARFKMCRWSLIFVTFKVFSYYCNNLIFFPCQEGETAVHCAAEIAKQQMHKKFEDTDLIRLLLHHDGDTNVQTRLVENLYHFPVMFINTGNKGYHCKAVLNLTYLNYVC